MRNWSKKASLLLLIIALFVTGWDRWNHAILSILTVSVLRSERAIAPIPRDTRMNWSNDSNRSAVCPALLAAIDTQPAGNGSLRNSARRLARFASLACESEDRAIGRFKAQLAAGYSPGEFDVLYMSEILDRNGFLREATELRATLPDVSLRYVDLGRIAIEQLYDETRGLAYFALANQIAPEFDSRKAALYRQLCLIELRPDSISAPRDPCEDFDRALPSALSRLLLGRRYYNRQAYTQAVALLRDAINLNPALGDAYYWLGKSWAGMGNGAYAEETFGKGIVEEPNYPWNYLELAQLRARAGCIDQARAYLEQMRSISDENVIAAADRALHAIENLNNTQGSCH